MLTSVETDTFKKVKAVRSGMMALVRKHPGSGCTWPLGVTDQHATIMFPIHIRREDCRRIERIVNSEQYTECPMDHIPR